MGQRRFWRATELLITADGGGSNSRGAVEALAQGLADDLGLKFVRLPLSAGRQQMEQDRVEVVEVGHALRE